MEGNVKLKVLFIDCHQTSDDKQITDYISWLEPFFNIEKVHVDRLSPTKVDTDAIIISGSERSLSAEPVPKALETICLETTRPLLGIGYGHQALAAAWGAKIVTKDRIEGEETIRTQYPKGIIHNLGLFFTGLESHSDQVLRNNKLMKNFCVLAESSNCPVEAIQHKERPLWGVQFHPEKSIPEGRQLAENFARIVKQTK
ncbi:gamma-glutamyl-gamma-aminobutyrate hydrolase family protein [candidate division WOR-3 bacterium]|nr:gamma-glutamyl-gamma-aminobutyrate hydrolase family protein [candidate division WOR-3 bacterium]